MIETDIQQTKRQMTGDTLRSLRKAAKKMNVSEDSLIWLMSDVFVSGHVRSRAYADCPKHVILDGLVDEGESGLLAYRPWRLTAKARDIMGRATHNVSDQTPAALDSANTTDGSSRLSASVLFVLGLSWWFLL